MRSSLSLTGSPRRKGLTRSVIALLAWAVVLWLPAGGVAGPSQLKLTFGARQEYNDNIFFNTDDKKADFITTGIFTVDLGHVAERLEMHAIGHWEGYTYWTNSNLNDVDQDYRLSLAYRLTPRIRGALSGAYLQDYHRDQETVETGVVFGNEKRTRYEMQSEWEFLLSEVTAVNISAIYWQDQYDQITASQEGGHNLKTYGGALGLTRALRVFQRPTYGRVNLGCYRYEYEDSDTDNFYLNIGFSTEIDETFTLLLDIGPRYTESEYTVLDSTVGNLYTIAAKETSRDWGGGGRLSIKYVGEKTDWVAALDREIAASSGQNQVVERTEARFDWRHWFTWECRGLLTLHYFINESSKSYRNTSDINEDTFVVYPRIFYRFSPNFSIQASYNYTWQKDNEGSSITERNQFLIEATYNWSMWE